MLFRLVCAFILFLSLLTSAQKSDEVLRRFQYNEALGGLRGPAAADAIKTLSECSSLAAKLQRAGGNIFPDEYMRSLISSATEASEIVHNGYIGSEQAKNLRIIAIDLSLKVQALEQDRLSVVPFVKVDVAAHTKNGSSEQDGVEVWWAFYSDRGHTNAYIKLRKDSSPATDQLFPGVYVMFTKEGNRKGPLTTVPIDRTGRIPVDFDLPTR